MDADDIDRPGTSRGRDTEPAPAACWLLDANAFDYLLDHDIEPRAVRGLGEILLTDVQHRELMSVPDRQRRKGLLRVVSGIDPTVRPAPRDDGSDGTGRPFHGPSRKPGAWKDAALAEVAAREGCIVVTDDKRFRERAARLGLSVSSCAEAFAGLAVRAAPTEPGPRTKRRWRRGGR